MFKKLIIICFIPILSACLEMENGEKVGQIIDLKQSGFFVKTWECKIRGTMGSSISFTIENKDLLNVAHKYMREKKFVAIKYSGELFTFIRSDSHNYFINSIEAIEENNDQEHNPS